MPGRIDFRQLSSFIVLELGNAACPATRAGCVPPENPSKNPINFFIRHLGSQGMLAQWLSAIWYLNLAATLALIVSLATNGLFRIYRCLFAYLVADATQTLILVAVSRRKNLYAYIYLAAQLLKLLLAVFVVLELYRLALAGRPALARFGQNTVSYWLAAAAAIAALGLALDRAVPPGGSPILHYFNSFERTMDAWLLIFLVLISCFMAWFPVRVKRNGGLYMAGFVIYFLSRFIGLLWSNKVPAWRHQIDAGMLGIGFACLLLWTVALRRQGEEATVVIGHRWDPSAMERLSAQLDAINARLLNVSRR
jgi:hypothetical protein